MDVENRVFALAVTMTAFATVSEKHANFIIADKTAKSSDVYDLRRKIKDAVKRKTGAELKEELKFIGKFND